MARRPQSRPVLQEVERLPKGVVLSVALPGEESGAKADPVRGTTLCTSTIRSDKLFFNNLFVWKGLCFVFCHFEVFVSTWDDVYSGLWTVPGDGEPQGRRHPVEHKTQLLSVSSFFI